MMLRNTRRWIRTSSRSLALMFVGMLALGVGIGSSFGIAGVFANEGQSAELHACVNGTTGAMRYVTDPNECTRYEKIVSWGGPTFVKRTAVKAVPANAGGQASNTVYCEPGEIAISGGSRTIYQGQHTFVGWVSFDVGGGPLESPASGWTEGYSFANTLPNTAVETWVTCMS